MKTKTDKKKYVRRIPRNNFKLETLDDAIVDGKFSVQIGSDVLIVRKISSRIIQCICTVRDIAPNGVINTWDNTIEQWFAFTVEEALKYNITIKKQRSKLVAT